MQGMWWKRRAGRTGLGEWPMFNVQGLTSSVQGPTTKSARRRAGSGGRGTGGHGSWVHGRGRHGEEETGQRGGGRRQVDSILEDVAFPG